MKIKLGLAAGNRCGWTSGSRRIKPVDVVPVDYRSPVAAGLLQRLQRELSPGPGNNRPASVEAPTGTGFTVLVLARDPASRTVYGCGGLLYLGANIAEIRNMYVVPEQRGSQTADSILSWLDDYARSRNWAALRLETKANRTAAVRFYERNGYTPIPRYGPYTGSSQSLCFEKTLHPSPFLTPPGVAA